MICNIITNINSGYSTLKSPIVKLFIEIPPRYISPLISSLMKNDWEDKEELEKDIEGKILKSQKFVKRIRDNEELELLLTVTETTSCSTFNPFNNPLKKQIFEQADRCNVLFAKVKKGEYEQFSNSNELGELYSRNELLMVFLSMENGTTTSQSSPSCLPNSQIALLEAYTRNIFGVDNQSKNFFYDFNLALISFKNESRKAIDAEKKAKEEYPPKEFSDHILLILTINKGFEYYSHDIFNSLWNNPTSEDYYSQQLYLTSRSIAEANIIVYKKQAWKEISLGDIISSVILWIILYYLILKKLLIYLAVIVYSLYKWIRI